MVVSFAFGSNLRRVKFPYSISLYQTVLYKLNLLLNYAISQSGTRHLLTTNAHTQGIAQKPIVCCRFVKLLYTYMNEHWRCNMCKSFQFG